MKNQVRFLDNVWKQYVPFIFWVHMNCSDINPLLLVLIGRNIQGPGNNSDDHIGIVPYTLWTAFIFTNNLANLEIV